MLQKQNLLKLRNLLKYLSSILMKIKSKMETFSLGQLLLLLEIFKNSPYSKEACLRLGILQQELLAKRIEDFQKEQVPEEFKEEKGIYHNIRFENYEYNR